MKILLRQATIADPHSLYNGNTADILIDNGEIVQIQKKIQSSCDVEIKQEGLIISPGWVDIFTHFTDPGFEHKETLETGSKAAKAGGFTRVFIAPNTQPAIDNKSTVEYILNKSKTLPVHIQPIGALTKNTAGKELAEMYDMFNSGAIAFSDGLTPIQSAGLLIKALQYVKSFNGTVFQLPIDKSINPTGLMHEGIISTQLGMPGIPAIAEELMLQKLITSLRYTNSKLHVTGISTQKSIEQIKAAKSEGLIISCSVTPYHLFFCDEDLQNYNTILKTDIPLRSKADMMALRQATMDGTIDCIASHHIPQDEDSKNCEFEYAKPGINCLENSFQILNSVLPELNNKRMVELLSTNARNIFQLPNITIQNGQIAELSLFTRNETTIIDKNNIVSRSSNNPFIGKELKGKVFGIINKGNLFLN